MPDSTERPKPSGWLPINEAASLLATDERAILDSNELDEFPAIKVKPNGAIMVKISD